MTKKEMKEKYLNGELKDSAVKPLGVYLSLVIVEVAYGIDDKIFGYFSGTEKDFFLRKLHTNEAGESYFKHAGNTHYINEFLRV